MIVVVVGVCGSGKTTLVKNLQKNGIDAYNVAQEHSCIKQLWKHKKPDKVIMLDASYDVIQQRRGVLWGQETLKEQHQRLQDALNNSDLLIKTDDLTIAEVSDTVLNLALNEGFGYLTRQTYHPFLTTILPYWYLLGLPDSS